MLHLFNSPKDIARWMSIYAILTEVTNGSLPSTKILLFSLPKGNAMYWSMFMIPFDETTCSRLVMVLPNRRLTWVHFLFLFFASPEQKPSVFLLSPQQLFFPCYNSEGGTRCNCSAPLISFSVVVSEVPAGPLLCFQLVEFLILSLTRLTDEIE